MDIVITTAITNSSTLPHTAVSTRTALSVCCCNNICYSVTEVCVWLKCYYDVTLSNLVIDEGLQERIMIPIPSHFVSPFPFPVSVCNMSISNPAEFSWNENSHFGRRFPVIVTFWVTSTAHHRWQWACHLWTVTHVTHVTHQSADPWHAWPMTQSQTMTWVDHDLRIMMNSRLFCLLFSAICNQRYGWLGVIK